MGPLTLTIDKPPSVFPIPTPTLEGQTNNELLLTVHALETTAKLEPAFSARLALPEPFERFVGAKNFDIVGMLSMCCVVMINLDVEHWYQSTD